MLDLILSRRTQLEKRKKQLGESVAAAGEQTPLLHPEMASHYRRQGEQLHSALEDADDTHRTEAREILRSLIDALISEAKMTKAALLERLLVPTWLSKLRWLRGQDLNL